MTGKSRPEPACESEPGRVRARQQGLRLKIALEPRVERVAAALASDPPDPDRDSGRGSDDRLVCPLPELSAGR